VTVHHERHGLGALERPSGHRPPGLPPLLVMPVVSPLHPSLASAPPAGRLLTPQWRQQCAWTCVSVSPARVCRRRGALRAMHSPAGAAVAGSGLATASGARRSVARSRRSPGAPPFTHSPTITSGWPVCAAARGLVSAATLKGTLRGWTAPASRWAVRRHSCPPEARQRTRMDAAPCLPSLPPRGRTRKAPAPLRSARATYSCHPQSPL
jgi:hypothetical protein